MAVRLLKRWLLHCLIISNIKCIYTSFQEVHTLRTFNQLTIVNKNKLFITYLYLHYYILHFLLILSQV